MAHQPTTHKSPKILAGKGYNHGIPMRTAAIFVVCVALCCLVWRVYGEENQNKNHAPVFAEFKDVLRKNYDQMMDILTEDQDLQTIPEKDIQNIARDVDAFDGQGEPVEDYEGIEPYEGQNAKEESQSSSNAEVTGGEAMTDEVAELYGDGYYQQQNTFNWFGEDAKEKENYESVNVNAHDEVEAVASNPEKKVEEDEQEKPQPSQTLGEWAEANGFDVGGIYYPNFYPEDQSDKKGEEKRASEEEEYDRYYEEALRQAIYEMDSGSQKGTEDEDDGDETIFVTDQGDAEIARAFPDLVGAAGAASKSESEDDAAVVDDYFPGYDEPNANDVDDYNEYNTAYANQNAEKEEASANQNDVEGATQTDADTAAQDLDDVYKSLIDPLQSALKFKERMDALYTAQIEALNYRSYIFDGAQFVAQLRQSLLEELTRFREGWDSLSSLPLVESPPSVDVNELPEEIKLDVALPGTLRKFIRLELQNQQLILSGTRQRRCSQNGDNYSVVTFFHSFPVPRGVRSDDIRAQFDDESQVMHVRIRKPSASRPDPTHIAIE